MMNIAHEICGYDISKIMFEGPVDKLKETRYTQLAIYLHSALLINLLDSAGKLNADAFAGHSVGEYAALYASGSISFEDGVRLTSKRGELMFSAGENEPGTMFAVIGMDDEEVEEICIELNKNEPGKTIVPANYNSPGQVVISGSRNYFKRSFPPFSKKEEREW